MKYLFAAGLLIYSAAAMCAENSPAVLDCKIENVKGNGAYVSNGQIVRLAVGNVIAMSVNNLTANGDEYTYDVLINGNTPFGKITISRSTGALDYENRAYGGASGTCAPESVKF